MDEDFFDGRNIYQQTLPIKSYLVYYVFFIAKNVQFDCGKNLT